MDAPQTAPAGDFGAVLVERGLITPQQLDEAIGAQRRHMLAGREPVPRLGEILIEQGILTEAQVAEVLEAQQKEILFCPRCEIQVNVPKRADAKGYRCSRCQGDLERPRQVRNVKVVDDEIIMVSREPLPPEVEQAAQDPARKFGKYVLLGEIGRGGLAVIHRAWDTFLNQYVALKFIKPATEATTDSRARSKHESRILDLVREARSAVRLRHPNIVPVYDVGRVGSEFYIAMELLQGSTLAERIREARSQGKVSPFYDEPRRYLQVVRDVARAVHYAHTRPTPVVHCDLKPSNVFLGQDGRTYVLDFGLARELRAGEDTEAQQGLVRGTPAYMAPEQAQGKPDEIDARTDVYGLGSVLYELLAGRPPFTGELFEVLHKAVSAMPERPSVVTAGKPGASSGRMPSATGALERICLRCLEKDRQARYQTAKEVAEEVDRLLRPDERGTRRAAAPPPAPDPAWKKLARAVFSRERWSRAWAGIRAASALTWRHRRRLAQVAMIGTILLLAGAVVYLVWVGGGPAERRTKAHLEALKAKVEDQLRSLKTEQAMATWIEAGRAIENPELQAWVQAERVEMDMIDQFKRALVRGINAGRHRVDVLRTTGGELRDVELLWGDENKLTVHTAGRAYEIRWEAIHADQVPKLGGVVLPDAPPSVQFGLGLYCFKRELNGEARRVLTPLVDTAVGLFARRYLERLDERR